MPTSRELLIKLCEGVLAKEAPTALHLPGVDEERANRLIKKWRAHIQLEKKRSSDDKEILDTQRRDILTDLTELLYSVEKSGVAAQHAAQLMYLFPSLSAAATWLKFYADNTHKDRPNVIYDLCLYIDTRGKPMPPYKLSSEQFKQQLFANPEKLRMVTCHLSDFQSTLNTDLKLDDLIHQINEKIEKDEIAHIKSTLGLELKENETEKKKKLEKWLHSIKKINKQYRKHELSDAAQMIDIMFKVAARYQIFKEPEKHPDIASNQIPEETAKVIDQIPNVMVKGEEIGLPPGFYIKKLARDDVRSLMVGVFMGSCQHVSGTGAKFAIHSTASPYGGVYAIFRGTVDKENNTTVVNEEKDVPMRMSWVWKGYKKSKDDESKKAFLCFDSIEQDETRKFMNPDKSDDECTDILFKACANQMLEVDPSIEWVTAGISARDGVNVGHPPMWDDDFDNFQYETPDEELKIRNENRYDSRNQWVLAERNYMPSNQENARCEPYLSALRELWFSMGDMKRSEKLGKFRPNIELFIDIMMLEKKLDESELKSLFERMRLDYFLSYFSGERVDIDETYERLANPANFRCYNDLKSIDSNFLSIAPLVIKMKIIEEKAYFENLMKYAHMGNVMVMMISGFDEEQKKEIIIRVIKASQRILKNEGEYRSYRFKSDISPLLDYAWSHHLITSIQLHDFFAGLVKSDVLFGWSDKVEDLIEALSIAKNKEDRSEIFYTHRAQLLLTSHFKFHGEKIEVLADVFVFFDDPDRKLLDFINDLKLNLNDYNGKEVLVKLIPLLNAMIEIQLMDKKFCYDEILSSSLSSLDNKTTVDEFKAIFALVPTDKMAHFLNKSEVFDCVLRLLENKIPKRSIVPGLSSEHMAILNGKINHYIDAKLKGLQNPMRMSKPLNEKQKELRLCSIQHKLENILHLADGDHNKKMSALIWFVDQVKLDLGEAAIRPGEHITFYDEIKKMHDDIIADATIKTEHSYEHRNEVHVLIDKDLVAKVDALLNHPDEKLSPGLGGKND